MKETPPLNDNYCQQIVHEGQLFFFHNDDDDAAKNKRKANERKIYEVRHL